jgi:hypothetical protein
MFAATEPTPHFRMYATVPSDIDCRAVDPKGLRRSAVGVLIGLSGTFRVRPRGTTGSQDQTIYSGNVTKHPIEIDVLYTGYGAGNIILYWER